MTFKVDNNMGIHGRRIIAAHMEYFNNIHVDAITWIQGMMLSRVISGRSDRDGRGEGYVGVITGNLKRTQKATTKKFVSELAPDPSGLAASYFRKVANWAKRKYGEDYYEITLTLFGDEAAKHIREEWERMIRFLNRGQSYNYQNPFPAVES